MCCNILNVKRRLTAYLKIAPSIIQLHATKLAVLGKHGDSIASALGALISVLTVAIVRDASRHQNVLVEHFEAIFHFGIFEQVGAHHVGFLLHRRLTPKRCDRLGTCDASLLRLIQVWRPP